MKVMSIGLICVLLLVVGCAKEKTQSQGVLKDVEDVITQRKALEAGKRMRKTIEKVGAAKKQQMDQLYDENSEGTGSAPSQTTLRK